MAKHLTDKDIADICEILDGWPADTKVSWDRLVEAVEHDLKFKNYTTDLAKICPALKNALKGVKAIVSGSTPKTDASLPPSLKVAAERLEKKDKTIKRLEEENRQLLEQFHVWLYKRIQARCPPSNS